MLVQLIQRGTHVLAIVTTAFKVDVQHAVIPKQLSYASAIALFENETTASIISAFNLPSTTPLGDLVAVVKLATGHDISLPAPGDDGQVVINRATLINMKNTQLKALHQSISALRGTSSKGKEKLIDDILKKHPQAIQDAIKDSSLQS